MDETITVPITDYLRLVADSEKFARLQAAGVDNWEGYDIAMSDED